MHSGNQASLVSPLILRLLAGLESGFVGGLGMFVWVAFSSRFLTGTPVWSIPNVLGSLFYGPGSAGRGFSRVTMAGLAVHIFVAVMVGIVLALLLRDSRNRVRATLTGVLLAVLWYHFSRAILFRRLGVFDVYYISPAALLAGHLIYGVLLGRYPGALESIRRGFSDATVPPAAEPPNP